MCNEKESSSELENYLGTLRENLPKIKQEYNVESLAIFGSYLHQNQDGDSDLDLLVEFTQTPTLFQFIRLENYLTELLGVKVDLVMKDALKPRIGKHVLKEAQPI